MCDIKNILINDCDKEGLSSIIVNNSDGTSYNLDNLIDIKISTVSKDNLYSSLFITKDNDISGNEFLNKILKLNINQFTDIFDSIETHNLHDTLTFLQRVVSDKLEDIYRDEVSRRCRDMFSEIADKYPDLGDDISKLLGEDKDE